MTLRILLAVLSCCFLINSARAACLDKDGNPIPCDWFYIVYTCPSICQWDDRSEECEADVPPEGTQPPCNGYVICPVLIDQDCAPVECCELDSADFTYAAQCIMDSATNKCSCVVHQVDGYFEFAACQ